MFFTAPLSELTERFEKELHTTLAYDFAIGVVVTVPVGETGIFAVSNAPAVAPPIVHDNDTAPETENPTEANCVAVPPPVTL